METSAIEPSSSDKTHRDLVLGTYDRVARSTFQSLYGHLTSHSTNRIMEYDFVLGTFDIICSFFEELSNDFKIV